RVPGEFRVDAGAQAIAGIGAGVEVLDEERQPLRMADHVATKRFERVPGDGAVVLPPDAPLGAGLAHDELVLRRAAGVASGLDHQSAAIGNPSLAPADDLFIEFRRAEIPLQCRRLPETGPVRVDAPAAVGLVHDFSPRSCRAAPTRAIEPWL